MLPDFNEIGYLPRGTYCCSLEEVLERFGVGSDERETLAVALTEFVEWARAAGVARLIVDGSFVTDRISPKDVDVAILRGPDYPRNEMPVVPDDSNWPFLDVKVAENEEDMNHWERFDFGLDRKLIPRGIVEIVL